MRRPLALLSLLAFAIPAIPQVAPVTFHGPVVFTISHVADSGAIQTFSGAVIVDDVTDSANVKTIANLRVESVKSCEDAGFPSWCTPGSTDPRTTLTLPFQVTDTSGKTSFFNYAFVLVTDNATPIPRQSQRLFGAFTGGVMPTSANITLLLGNTKDSRGYLDILEFNGFKWRAGTNY